MKVYAFDLMPWPHLEAPSHYPDSNALFDPERGGQIYAEHLEIHAGQIDANLAAWRGPR